MTKKKSSSVVKQDANNPYLQDHTVPQWLYTSKAPLTPMQRLFVEYYSVSYTNTVSIMNASDIPITLEEATKMGKLPNVKLAIKEKDKHEETVAQKKARQLFWSKVMNDTSQDMKDRLKASELLGKSEKDFVEKVEHSVETDLVQAIYEARNRYRNPQAIPEPKDDTTLKGMLEGC